MTDGRNVQARDGTLTTRPGTEIFADAGDMTEVVIDLDPEVFPSPSVTWPGIVGPPDPDVSPSPPPSPGSPSPPPSEGACPSCLVIQGYEDGVSIMPPSTCTPDAVTGFDLSPWVGLFITSGIIGGVLVDGCAYTVAGGSYFGGEANKYRLNESTILREYIEPTDGTPYYQWRMTINTEIDSTNFVYWTGILPDAGTPIGTYVRESGCCETSSLAMIECADSCLPCVQIAGYDPGVTFPMTGDCNTAGASAAAEWDGKLTVGTTFPCGYNSPSYLAIGGKRLAAATIGWYFNGFGVVVGYALTVTALTGDGFALLVWRGTKSGVNTPIGTYTRAGGCDATATLDIEECTSASPTVCASGDLLVTFSGVTGCACASNGKRAINNPDAINAAFCATNLGTIGTVTSWQYSMDGLFTLNGFSGTACDGDVAPIDYNCTLNVTRDSVDAPIYHWAITVEMTSIPAPGASSVDVFRNPGTTFDDNENDAATTNDPSFVCDTANEELLSGGSVSMEVMP